MSMVFIFFIVPVLFIFGRFYDPERRRIIKLMTIPFIPYLVYLVYIGGDHFEFRPLMPIIPFLAILAQEGIRAAYGKLSGAAKSPARLAVPVYLAVMLFFLDRTVLVIAPEFPESLRSGCTGANRRIGNTCVQNSSHKSIPSDS